MIEATILRGDERHNEAQNKAQKNHKGNNENRLNTIFNNRLARLANVKNNSDKKQQ